MVLSKLIDQYSKKPIAVRYRQGILLITVSLLIIFLIIIMVQIFASLRTQFVKQKGYNLNSTIESLDVLFSTVENYSKAILSDDQIQQTLIYPPEDAYTAEKTVRRQINQYILTFNYVDAVLIRDLNGACYDSGGILLGNPGAISDYPEEFIWLPVHPAGYYTSYGSAPPMVVSLARPIYNGQTGELIGHIEMCIDEELITNTYLQNELSDLGEYYYIVDADNRIIAHPDRSLLLTEDTAPLTSDPTELWRDGDSYVISRQDRHTGWYIKSVFPLSLIYQQIRELIPFLLIIVFVLIVISFVAASYTARRMTRGITVLTSEVKTLDSIADRVSTADGSPSDEISVLRDAFNSLLERFESTSEQLVEAQQQKRRFQLELIQQQLNPHFLYNTLSNVGSMAILGENEKIVCMIENITRFYRGVLSKGNVVIPLQEELEIADSYMQILKMRVHDRFFFLMRVDPAVMDNVCLKLLLQPILENAYQHGIPSLPDGEGRIELSARAEDGVLVVSVSDNGVGMSQAQIQAIYQDEGKDYTKHSFGLRNVHQRIQLYFGKSYGLDVISKEARGTTIVLRLPIKTWEETDDQAVDQINDHR